MCDPVCVSVLVLPTGNLRLQCMCVYVLSLSMILSMSKTYPAFTAVRKLKYYKVDSKEQIRTCHIHIMCVDQFSRICRYIWSMYQLHHWSMITFYRNVNKWSKITWDHYRFKRFRVSSNILITPITPCHIDTSHAYCVMGAEHVHTLSIKYRSWSCSLTLH